MEFDRFCISMPHPEQLRVLLLELAPSSFCSPSRPVVAAWNLAMTRLGTPNQWEMTKEGLAMAVMVKQSLTPEVIERFGRRVDLSLDVLIIPTLELGEIWLQRRSAPSGESSWCVEFVNASDVRECAAACASFLVDLGWPMTAMEFYAAGGKGPRKKLAAVAALEVLGAGQADAAELAAV